MQNTRKKRTKLSLFEVQNLLMAPKCSFKLLETIPKNFPKKVDQKSSKTIFSGKII